MKTIVIASGYFDPLHEGHIEYLKMAYFLGDTLTVIVNNDQQAQLKKGYSFMQEYSRMEILKSIKYVDEVVISIDTDLSVSKTLELLSEKQKGNKLIFAKGGDRSAGEIPERNICQERGIKIIDGLGKKIQSSSNLIKQVQVKD